MTIHLIHGIHPSQPGGTVAKLKPFLERRGHDVKVHEYGWAFALTARFLNPGRAQKIAEFIEPHDIIIAHSNGVDIAHKIQQIKPVCGIVAINAALDIDAVFDKVNWVHVYHNWGDTVVSWTENPWFALTGHSWGEMGRWGYIGHDKRVTNFHGEKVKPLLWGHSDFFNDFKINAWSEFMMDQMENAYACRYNGTS